MKYEKVHRGIFLERPNRFVAKALINGKEETVHVKNTGRCKELLIRGRTIILEEGSNPNRKTKYSIIAVYKGDRLINIDSQAPNRAAWEGLCKGSIKEIGIPEFVNKEVGYKNSRFDLYYEKEGKKGFIEVKGVTLEEDGVAMFPDAPTKRGVKHIQELMEAKKEGYETWILFFIQMKGMKVFRTNDAMDPDFAAACVKAKKRGVHILVYDSIVKEDGMDIDEIVSYKYK